MRIIIRNYEIIPADSVFIKGQGKIDYSFVTGESIPVTISSGDKVYAGGRQMGQSIELETIKKLGKIAFEVAKDREIIKK